MVNDKRKRGGKSRSRKAKRFFESGISGSRNRYFEPIFKITGTTDEELSLAMIPCGGANRSLDLIMNCHFIIRTLLKAVHIENA
ncbi:hypothetical protein PT2222_130352 [Paraburkholderia tropica]